MDDGQQMALKRPMTTNTTNFEYNARQLIEPDEGAELEKS